MLATKLFQPPLRSDLVARPRLTGLLDEAVRQGCSLILVCAPPGFGKSMMVASWLSERAAAERPLASALFSLDRNDNDPVAFWRYVIAALSRVDPAIGRSMDAALVAGQPPALEPLITGLINDLTKPLFGQETPSARTWHSGAPLILVLDDYHVIEAEAIHQSLSFFIDHLPSNTAVVVITRVDPPLALARRRARQQLAEVRVNGLRFTRAETGEFLAKSGLDLVDEDLSVLEQRAEGWVVGLQLAALSLRDCTDRHAFITAFAGDNRYVVDYLLEEVLQHLPANIQDFLLKTSILERFCAALCDDVIRDSSIRSSEEREQLFSHIPDPETQITNSQSIISHLEQSNLFTLPLDSQRRWYRYHHLFADLLRRRLRQSLSGAEILELYRRACAWFERAGLPEEAVSLALAAPDYASAADIMERHVLAFYYRSEAAIIKRWFQALPEDMLRSRPLLCAVKACLISLSPPYPPESTRLAEEWLCQAEKSLQDRGESMDEARGFITQFRPYLSRFKQEPLSIVIALTHQALEALPPEDDPRAAGNANFLRFRSALITNLGLVNLSLGNVEEAAQVLRDSRRLGLKCGDLFNASASTTFLALISIIQGQLPEAFAICRDFLLALQNATPRSPGPVP
ncbi:MAG: hypothetical protein EHM21_04710 [Chloroflexi bacterium]|nr:MAG: hypothetical protein EHM21_04710 [Chloroflexota bacterium]